MTEKLLTIAIPTFNRAKELEHLISSIIPQMTPLVEILVSDNASIDATPNLMARLMVNNPSICYVRLDTNVLIDRNIESAVVNSSGKFVWLCGDDDELEPFAIAYILGVLQSGDFATGWVNCSRWDSELKDCWSLKIAELNEDMLDANVGDVISASRLMFSFLSAHIIRRDLWLGTQGREKCFVPPFTDCIWMLVHLLSGIQGKNFVIAKPLLRQRTSKYDNVKVAQTSVLLNWCQLMELAVNRGVPKKDVESFFRSTVNELHLTRSVLHKKKFAPQAAIKEMPLTFNFFWQYPMFWLTVVPLYLMPGFMIKGMRNLYRWQREMGGFQWKL